MVSLFRLMVTADEIMKLTETDNSFKTMEMSLNKDGVMLDKSKMLIMNMPILEVAEEKGDNARVS